MCLQQLNPYALQEIAEAQWKRMLARIGSLTSASMSKGTHYLANPPEEHFWYSCISQFSISVYPPTKMDSIFFQLKSKVIFDQGYISVGSFLVISEAVSLLKIILVLGRKKGRRLPYCIAADDPSYVTRPFIHVINSKTKSSNKDIRLRKQI